MSEKDDVKQRYDGFADSLIQHTKNIKDYCTDVSPVMKYFRQRKIETALELGGFKKGTRILEVGSNVGQYTTLLAEKGFQMVGIDLSDKIIDIARKIANMRGLGNIEYFTMDAEDLSAFKDDTFTGVVSFSTLRYVPDLKKALKEIYRVTKPGGTVALDFPNKHCPWFSLLKNRFGVENHIHDHFYSAEELISLFKEAGFTDISTKKIMFTHYTFNSKFLNLYKALDWIGENIIFIKEMAAIVFCKGVKR